MKWLVVWFFLPFFVHAQVNIEQYRSSTATGNIKNSQYVNISTSITRSVDSVYSVGIKYYKALPMSNVVDGFLISNIQYGERNGSSFLNRSFHHLRIVSEQDYGGVFPEVFGQYESNDSALTELRYLAGMGVRMPALSHLVLGTSIVSEWYKEAEMPVKEHVWRLSQYFKTFIQFNATNRLDIVFYIQPNINDFSNIRYFSECSYTSMLSNNISYSSALSLKYFSNSINYKNVEMFLDTGLNIQI
jgi:hypothetical protein